MNTSEAARGKAVQATRERIRIICLPVLQPSPAILFPNDGCSASSFLSSLLSLSSLLPHSLMDLQLNCLSVLVIIYPTFLSPSQSVSHSRLEATDDWRRSQGPGWLTEAKARNTWRGAKSEETKIDGSASEEQEMR